VPTDFESLEELSAIAGKVMMCFSKAKGGVPTNTEEQLARDAFEVTSNFLARDNIQAMIKVLDDAAG